jgi:hypothetical protein
MWCNIIYWKMLNLQQPHNNPLHEGGPHTLGPTLMWGVVVMVLCMNQIPNLFFVFSLLHVVCILRSVYVLRSFYLREKIEKKESNKLKESEYL